MNDTIMNYYFFLLNIMESIFKFHFFVRFLGSKIKWVHYLYCFIFSLLCYMIFQHDNTILYWLITNILFLFLTGIFIYKANWTVCVLSAVIIIEMMQLSSGVINSFTAMLSHYLFSIHPNLIGFMIIPISNISIFLLSYYCFQSLYKNLKFENAEQNQYMYLFFVPLILLLVLGEYVIDFIYGPVVTIDEKGVVLGVNHLQMFIIQLLCILSLFCIVRIYQKLMLSIADAQKLALLKQETAYQKKYVEEAKTRYQQTQAFRHDFKNHILIIDGLLNKEDYQKAKQYLNKLEKSTNALSFSIHTNNAVLDILLNIKCTIAIQHNIKVSCTLAIPKPCYVDDMDFCIVFSNALDNAITACKKVDNQILKYIQISGCLQGEFFMVEIINGCQEQNPIQKDIGLSNIQSVVEKYNGAMHIEQQPNQFGLHLLFIISQQSKSISHQNS